MKHIPAPLPAGQISCHTDVKQHRAEEFKGFSKKYQMKRLVYAEAGSDVRAAIMREKQLKGSLASLRMTTSLRTISSYD